MGATSVTGVSGYGSVEDGFNRGSEHMTLGVNHLIGPRILAAGSITLSGTTGTVAHETLPDTTSNVVILTSNSVTPPFVTAASRTTSSFGVTGASAAVIAWIIVSNGNAVSM